MTTKHYRLVVIMLEHEDECNNDVCTKLVFVLCCKAHTYSKIGVVKEVYKSLIHSEILA